ncbi:hypothetical protein GCM10023075_71710 [Streptosporangium album]
MLDASVETSCRFRAGDRLTGVWSRVRFVRFADNQRAATHYSFRPDWRQAADPESKGIVENLVGYAKRDLLSALPSLRPATGKAPATRKVDKLSCVRFGSARYSVPAALIGGSGRQLRRPRDREPAAC